MSITIDGQKLFDEQYLDIKAESFSHDLIERAVPGLDGVISVGLGRRGRRIKQTGTLRGKSRARMNDRINAIMNNMDGNTHLFVTGDGREYDNIRMDSFKVTNERVDGAFLVIDYEIIYTQLSQ